MKWIGIWEFNENSGSKRANYHKQWKLNQVHTIYDSNEATREPVKENERKKKAKSFIKQHKHKQTTQQYVNG